MLACFSVNGYQQHMLLLIFTKSLNPFCTRENEGENGVSSHHRHATTFQIIAQKDIATFCVKTLPAYIICNHNQKICLQTYNVKIRNND